MDLWGSDFDGDGLLDLVVAEGEIVELWYNWGGGFDPALQLFNAWFVGLADGDGDGDMDLLVHEFDDSAHLVPSQVSLWINDGYDFVDSDTFVLDSEEARWPLLPAGQPLGAAASLLWHQSCHQFQESDSWPLTRPWAAIEQPPLVVEVPADHCNLNLHLIADLDDNGTTDLLGSSERIDWFYHGLALWRLSASGEWTRHSLLDWKCARQTPPPATSTAMASSMWRWSRVTRPSVRY